MRALAPSRNAVTKSMKMLRDARTAGSVKQYCAADLFIECPVWAALVANMSQD